MLDEVLRELDPRPGDVVCDCTLGGAGHTVELAKRVAPDGLSLGIDQDDMALAAATERFEREVPDGRHRFLKGNFGDLDDLLVGAEVPGVDCFLFDLGVSSPQLDIPMRGFSYHEDAPLDMRMDPGTNTLTAAEVIQNYTAADLTRILRLYGDEKYASRIAAEICRRREKAPIETTFQLVDAVKAGIPAAARRHGGHPARKTFQALRIEVNHELDVLERGLEAAVRWTNTGGRICVISYQSLEDRITKHIFSEMSQGCICPPDLPVCVCGHVPIVEVRTRKPLVAGEEELARNPRARSAKMRVAVKLDVTQAS
ncbi:MAG: 16S rRNA (cytosine(1402)-N(4))-methyltransferase RsmH [Atopobiaceae bacterium]|jgi:16S rRNA (cytosine1402-N4)-methyltransferase|nr:16S rRNA (cytosine(1402)-N(4))-methyltransferase RsmH [Atopobiaceae bacterium]MCH4180465.1 16S rRNA (cytosine(1402)-N(4))-methyltransferase RsmH [Atopobiaceae bacterium]MCH4214159.1 16S rRNA (cytosine(1402)-N(4))-methyltransferase RsmH [Atopobiaceae bacterium]MCH4229496.1 16S rRNA (cytosine(1402)-N(4))-methyltransferase RsmH [Atopobiaceae bacterium]MCH4275825.1 16S rRNA (cytosine(1402)-N(4))-methyltransferase RsmH [Atopobiaceae bacterium]